MTGLEANVAFKGANNCFNLIFIFKYFGIGMPKRKQICG